MRRYNNYIKIFKYLSFINLLIGCKNNDEENIDTTLEFSITFESNGGSPISPLSLVYNASLDMITEPIKEGFFFSGWYTDIQTILPFTSLRMPHEDITLYARWEMDITQFPKLILDITSFTSNFEEFELMNIDAENDYYFYNTNLADANINATITKTNNLFVELWDYSILGDSDDYISEIFIDSNNDVLLTGFSSSNNLLYTGVDYGLDDFDGLLIKLDESGNEIFAITYGGSGMDYIIGALEYEEFYYVYGATTSNDGDFISNLSATYSEFILKVDEDGEIISINYLENFAEDYDWYDIEEIKLIDDSLYVFGTLTEIVYPDIETSTIFAFKANLDFEIEWQYFLEIDDVTRDLKFVECGEYIELFGSIDDYDVNKSRLVYIKLDYLGNLHLTWDSEFEYNGLLSQFIVSDDTYYASIKNSDGTYVIIGENDNYGDFSVFLQGVVNNVMPDKIGDYILIGSIFSYDDEQSFSGVIKIPAN